MFKYKQRILVLNLKEKITSYTTKMEALEEETGERCKRERERGWTWAENEQNKKRGDCFESYRSVRTESQSASCTV